MSAIELLMKILARLPNVDAEAVVRVVHRGADGEVLRVEQAPITHVAVQQGESAAIQICINANDLAAAE